MPKMKQAADSEVSLAQLKDTVGAFCGEREWDQFHNAKDLCIGICTEASELLQHFRFKSESEVERVMANPQTRSEIAEEVADVFFFLIRLAQRYDIDLSSALKAKLKANAIRYPIETAKGSNKKYGEL
jgi:NTP pyrophosphatase (non-canonical NTP hydrolase)